MKKILSLLALTVLVSSCGNKLTLLKRHYTGGYYVHHNNGAGKGSAVANNSVKQATVTMKPTAVSFVNVEIQAPVLTASVKENKARVSTGTSYLRHLTGNAALQRKNVIAPVKLSTKAVAVLKESKRTGGEANIVLLVILSLFPILALVAMYLHDGHQVTANFWVDLLLHLTIIGYIIFALLVDFDIVNLA